MHRMDASDTNPREGRRLFGVFEFELRTGELSKDGRPVALRPQAQRLLALLVASAGNVVSRAEIQRELWWGDTIVDFEHGIDRINLVNIDANDMLEGNQAFTFIGTERFHKVAGELHIYHLADGNTYISGDTNGDGGAEFAIKVLGWHTVTSADFVL